LQLFGGPAAVEEAARLRELHRPFRGIGFSGERYSALDPDAYAWVHLSNLDASLSFHRWFGRPLGLEEREQLYAEWCQVGRMLGIANDRLPANLKAYRNYVSDMVADTLEDNPTARTLLKSLQLGGVSSPSPRYLPEPVWRVLRPLGGAVLHDVTVGTLPAQLRERLGLRWNTVDHRRLQAAAVLVRAVSATMPDIVQQYPMGGAARREARRFAAGTAAA
jgi:uncharacterized protein (DUF2236 family)